VLCILAIFFLGRAIRRSLPLTRTVQKFLYDWQHPIDCFAVDWVVAKFRRDDAGIGSEIHSSTAVFAWALNHNAIFVFVDTNWMMYHSWCIHSKSFECVFHTTNCTLATLNPARRIEQYFGFLRDEFPLAFKDVDASPYPRLYWWRSQAAFYLTRFNVRFSKHFNDFKASKPPLSIPCGSVCAYVRRGDKAKEMELAAWSRYNSAIHVAHELMSSRKGCYQSNFSVFLMTDDALVVDEAKLFFGERLLTVQGGTVSGTYHPGNLELTNSSAQDRFENFMTVFLSIRYCVQCDAFVGQRASNMARLIDELRLTKAGKYLAPFVDVGDYTFGW
jgi:hypothetical protein